ncbi:MAG: sulfite exporter TauE/SafE family protein [Limisphaerales bacterium]
MKLVFRCWLGVFYLTWAIWIVASDQLMVVASHWPIACSMALGSFFAGSTPMGGGSIGFPVLVLWMQEASSLGRDFSFAIQSIGMVSASLYILSMRQPLQWRLLRGAMLGTLVGTPLGLLYLSPLIPSLWVKVVFSVLWGAFGIFHLIRLSSLAAAASGDNLKRATERETGFVLGLIGGGTVAALTGVGVDMLIYMVMILWLRTDLRVAIPTSVLLMAMTSVIG